MVDQITSAYIHNKVIILLERIINTESGLIFLPVSLGNVTITKTKSSENNLIPSMLEKLINALTIHLKKLENPNFSKH